MGIIFVLVPLSLLLALSGFIAFMWANKKGQFQDLETPAERMLLDDEDESIKKS